MEEVIDRFIARSYAETEVSIVEYGRYMDAPTLDGSAVVRALSRFELEDGSSGVNQIDDQTFKIVQTGKIVRRIN